MLESKENEHENYNKHVNKVLNNRKTMDKITLIRENGGSICLAYTGERNISDYWPKETT